MVFLSCISLSLPTISPSFIKYLVSPPDYNQRPGGDCGPPNLFYPPFFFVFPENFSSLPAAPPRIVTSTCHELLQFTKVLKTPTGTLPTLALLFFFHSIAPPIRPSTYDHERSEITGNCTPPNQFFRGALFTHPSFRTFHAHLPGATSDIHTHPHSDNPLDPFLNPNPTVLKLNLTSLSGYFAYPT